MTRQPRAACTGPGQELPVPRMQLGHPTHGLQLSRLPPPGPSHRGTRSPCSHQDGSPTHEEVMAGTREDGTGACRHRPWNGPFRSVTEARSWTVGSNAFPTGLNPSWSNPRAANTESSMVAFCQALVWTYQLMSVTSLIKINVMKATCTKDICFNFSFVENKVSLNSLLPPQKNTSM